MPKYQPGTVVQAKHDFSSPHGHCLQLKSGDRVTIVRSKNKDDEWLAGKNISGKVGFFPALYVKAINTADDTAGSARPASASELNGEEKVSIAREGAPVGRRVSSSPKSGKTAPANLKLTLDGSDASLSRNSFPQFSIGSVPSPRWLAPTHLTSVALFKYFADGHFGFDDDRTGSSRKGGLFKKHTLKESDLLKFGKKAIKLPLHRTLWAKYAEDVPDGTGDSSKIKRTGADGGSRHAGPSAAALNAMRKQQGAVENFKNIMRYMGDMPLHRKHGVAAGNHGLSTSIMDNLERDALRSKMIQLGLTHDAALGARVDGDAVPGAGSGSMVDEIWCQLMKQTTSNPQHGSEVAGWELIATIAGVFKPSIGLFPCVFQFVHDRCFETDEIGALAVYTLRQLMAKREMNVATPSARHQANIPSNVKLADIAAAPLPASVFGATLSELCALEKFCGEVSVYRDAVSDLNDVSRKLNMDSGHMGMGAGDGGGISVASRQSGGEQLGCVGMTTNSLFESITAEDVQHVTTGGELDLKSTDSKSYRRRYVWVPDTLDRICWCRGDCKNESKFKTLSLSLLDETKRAPPTLGYDTKANNPYVYFSLLASGKGGAHDHKHSMDFKTLNGSDCERWVQALRVLLQTASGSRRAIENEAREAMRSQVKKSLPMAFTVNGCGEITANGEYRSVQRTKNGARVYMRPNGFVLSREIIEGKAGWIIGKDQRAYYGTAEKTGSVNKGASVTADGFSPPLVGWRVFDGKPPAPTLAETTQSKVGVDVASLAAATAVVKSSKGMAAKRISFRVLTPDQSERPASRMGRSADESEDTQFVPLVAKLLCQAVRNLGGFEQEGIFRKAGSRKDAEAIRELIHKGNYSVLRVKPRDHRRGSTVSSITSSISAGSSLSSSSGLGATGGGGRSKPQLKDANVAADVLKQWLRAMPEPLIEFKLYGKAVDAGNRKSASDAAAVVWGLCDEHRQTLLYLLKFFWDLMQTEDTTKMGAAQIAIVIMPNIIKSEHLSSNPAMAIMNANAEKDFVKTLLENYETVARGPM